MANEPKTIESLEAEIKQLQDEKKGLEVKVSALETEKHDLQIKNEALHELSLHKTTQSGNKRLMEDFE